MDIDLSKKVNEAADQQNKVTQSAQYQQLATATEAHFAEEPKAKTTEPSTQNQLQVRSSMTTNDKNEASVQMHTSQLVTSVMSQ